MANMNTTSVPSSSNASGQVGTGSNTNIDELQAEATVPLEPVPHPGGVDDV